MKNKFDMVEGVTTFVVICLAIAVFAIIWASVTTDDYDSETNEGGHEEEPENNLPEKPSEVKQEPFRRGGYVEARDVFPKAKKVVNTGNPLRSQDDIKRHNWGVRKAAEEFRYNLLQNATESELIFKAALNGSIYRDDYEFQKIVYIFNKNNKHIIDKFYIMDFYFPKYKVDVEIDGGYHYVNEQKEKDFERSREIFRNSGIKTYRIDNSKVTDKNIVVTTIKAIKNMNTR